MHTSYEAVLLIQESQPTQLMWGGLGLLLNSPGAHKLLPMSLALLLPPGLLQLISELSWKGQNKSWPACSARWTPAWCWARQLPAIPRKTSGMLCLLGLAGPSGSRICHCEVMVATEFLQLKRKVPCGTLLGKVLKITLLHAELLSSGFTKCVALGFLPGPVMEKRTGL